MPQRPPGHPRGDPRWSTCLKNHAKAVIACNFCPAVTTTFRLLYVFVVIHHHYHSRRLVHFNMIAHPASAWTLQQLREAVGECYRTLLHDRDSIFAQHLDEAIRRLGLTVFKSPPHSPKAIAICERVIGTIWRECLDCLIRISESHLRLILKE